MFFGAAAEWNLLIETNKFCQKLTKVSFKTEKAFEKALSATLLGRKVFINKFFYEWTWGNSIKAEKVSNLKESSASDCPTQECGERKLKFARNRDEVFRMK